MDESEIDIKFSIEELVDLRRNIVLPRCRRLTITKIIDLLKSIADERNVTE